ncbi:MAG: zinc ribbon domain-containing protein [Bacillota bacterium]|nr:zinc ribbon domain-containing protein [Bacillota bacterium]
MPTYEFICKGCGNRFSLFTTIAGRARACCPSCQGSDLQQVFKGVMFVKGNSSGGQSSSSSGGGGCSRTSCSGCAGC